MNSFQKVALVFASAAGGATTRWIIQLIYVGLVRSGHGMFVVPFTSVAAGAIFLARRPALRLVSLGATMGAMAESVLIYWTLMQWAA